MDSTASCGTEPVEDDREGAGLHAVVHAAAFGGQFVGGVSPPQAVTVTNRADRPLRMASEAVPATVAAFRSEKGGDVPCGKTTWQHEMDRKPTKDAKTHAQPEGRVCKP